MNENNSLWGLDGEIQNEEKEANSEIVPMKKRMPFCFWNVGGRDYRLKLTTGMVARLENKYKTNVITLVTSDNLPPLTVMLTVAQAAMAPWEHGITSKDVENLYNRWLEEGGNQVLFFSKVIMQTLAVSGFFTEKQSETVMESLEEMDSLL